MNKILIGLLRNFIEVSLPFNTDKNNLNSIVLKTYNIISGLHAIFKISFFLLMIFYSFFSTNKFFLPFIFCNYSNRKYIINNSYLFNNRNNFFLRILKTYSWLCFYDNETIQEKIDYREKEIIKNALNNRRSKFKI